jgi:hypothetical protein
MHTLLPSDVMTNTFHWTELSPIGLEAAADALTPVIADFYESVYAGSLGMGNYMRPTLATVNWYDLSQPAPRAPYTLPLGATIPVVVTQLPTEVATVLSFQGDQISGTPQSRRRGRIYIGAIADAAVVPTTTSIFPRWTTSWLSGITAGATNFLLGNSVPGVRWSVWSPTDQSAALVTNGWVDDSPDTQRRRSVFSTSRQIWP